MSDDEYLRDILKQTEEIETMLLQFFKERDKIDLWMNCPNLNLGGVSPLTLIRLGRGHKVIMFIKSAIEGY